MAKIKFTADSTCDLTKELIEKLDLDIINLYVSLGEKTFRDGIDIFPETIFDFVEKNNILPKTAAPSPEDYSVLFSKYSKTYDAVIHFNISSGVSASNQNANVAVKSFDNVYIIDSLSLSTGTSLLILKADSLRKEGKTVNEIIETINALRQNVVSSFVVDTLEYLHKGGRCSGIARLGATILKLHPVLLLKNGSITVHKKLRGKISDVYTEFVKILKKEFSNPHSDYVFITASGSSNAIIDSVKQKLEELYSFKNIYVTTAGSTITSHCGKGTVGIMFVNDTAI